MKKWRGALALVLVLAMLLGLATAAAADNGAGASAPYAEAVELFTNLKVNGASVLSALGGKSLQANMTRNDAAKLINALHIDGRTWGLAETDFEITGEQFFAMVDRLLCTDGWFEGARQVDAWLNRYLTGLGKEYEAAYADKITAEEACQVLMNALDSKVQYGVGWYLRDELRLAHEFSTEKSNTDAWGRPVSRWTQNGQPLTQWRTANAEWVGQGTVKTHDLLERLGVFDYGAGNFQNNMWCKFNICANGGTCWEAPKLHWNHDTGTGCQANWISQRAGSRMEVYYLGDGFGYLRDAGGEVPYRNYYVVYIDDYLAKIENQTISIYSNEGGAIWSWSAPELPTQDGWYIINLNLKNLATALPVRLAQVRRSGQSGAELPAADGFHYVTTEDGRKMLSSKCQLGFELISGGSSDRLNFFYDTWGNVIGALKDEVVVPTDTHDHEWAYAFVSASQHERWCTVCNKFELEDHVLTYRDPVEATETEPGFTGDCVCVLCGEKIADGEVIAPHRHVLAEEWSYDSACHWKECTVENCNHRGELAEHEWDEESERCLICGAAYDEEASKSGSLLWMLLLGGGMPFEDVAPDAWYYDSVQSAWCQGLIDGMDATTFAPDSNLTVAQAIKLSAALHKKLNCSSDPLYNGEANWYDTYVSYAVENGVIDAKYASYSPAQMNAVITRQEFVHILYGAHAFYGYRPMNSIADNSIPDVKMGSAYASEIYAFYRAGILTGSDAAGTFCPGASIKRSEVAAILVRMYDDTARQYVSLP